MSYLNRRASVKSPYPLGLLKPDLTVGRHRLILDKASPGGAFPVGVTRLVPGYLGSAMGPRWGKRSQWAEGVGTAWRSMLAGSSSPLRTGILRGWADRGYTRQVHEGGQDYRGGMRLVKYEWRPPHPFGGADEKDVPREKSGRRIVGGAVNELQNPVKEG